MHSVKEAPLRHHALRAAAIFQAAILLVLANQPARAAAVYEINVILPLTGNIAFVGATQLQALKAVELYVNRTGGIDGRQLSFVVADDQSDVKTSLLLAQVLVAKNVPIFLGSSSPQACAAVGPLIAQHGPVHYCLGNGGHPLTGGYEFFTQFNNESQMAVLMRYVRHRGMHKIATIFSIDGGGQDAEQAFMTTTQLPENKTLDVVAREHFTATDLSVTAQMAHIKAAKPDLLLAWATGTPAGTLLRSARDTGIDLPTITSTGNLNASFFKQFSAILPSNLFFAAVPYYAGDALNNEATKAAIATMTNSLAAVGAKPDMIEMSAWDPAMLIVDALRKIGPDATADMLRAT
jgi:branched-chain amino acid transport system substrate-binding protein